LNCVSNRNNAVIETGAVFAGKKVEELAQIQSCARFTPILAEVSGFPKDLLVRDSPRYASDCKAKEAADIRPVNARAPKEYRTA
jgi:hypothetical protein